MGNITYISACCFCVCLLVLNDSVFLVHGGHPTVYSGLVDLTGYNALRQQVTLCSQVTKHDLQKQHWFMFDCMTKHIRHCADYFVRPIKKHVTFCGRLSVASRSLRTQVYISSWHKHVVLFRFMVFVLHRTFYQCGPDKVELSDVTINHTHTYCGRRTPWSVITTGRNSHLLISIHDNHGSTLSVFYSAQHINHIHSILEEREWELPNPHLGFIFSKLLVAHSIVYCTSPHLTIRAEIQWKQRYELMTIYDGPGRRSSSILKIRSSSYSGTYSALSSAFCMYIVMEHKPINMDQTTISIGTQLSRPAKCPHFSNPNRKLTVIKLHPSNYQYNYVCVKEMYQAPIFEYRFFPFFNFIVFTFNGPDTITSLHQGCNYGGVFIQEIGNSSSNFYKSFCHSSRHTAIYSDIARVKIFVIWFQGYHSAKLAVRMHYKLCPTTYVRNVFKNAFTKTLTCRHFLCEKSECKIHLIRNNYPIGPTILQLSASQKLSAMEKKMTVKVHVPIMCSSNIDVMYSSAKHWPFERDIYWRRIKYNYSKTTAETITEHIKFLHNASVSIRTCHKSPVGIAIYVPHCGERKLMLHNYFLMSPPECVMSIPILQNVTVYSFEVVGSPLAILISYYDDCSLTCRGHGIILHEKTLNDVSIYEYSATLLDIFRWQTHTNQCALRLRITPPVTCSQSCKVYVDISEVDYVSTSDLITDNNDAFSKFVRHDNLRLVNIMHSTSLFTIIVTTVIIKHKPSLFTIIVTVIITFTKFIHYHSHSDLISSPSSFTVVVTVIIAFTKFIHEHIVTVIIAFTKFIHEHIVTVIIAFTKFIHEHIVTVIIAFTKLIHEHIVTVIIAVTKFIHEHIVTVIIAFTKLVHHHSHSDHNVHQVHYNNDNIIKSLFTEGTGIYKNVQKKIKKYIHVCTNPLSIAHPPWGPHT